MYYLALDLARRADLNEQRMVDIQHLRFKIQDREIQHLGFLISGSKNHDLGDFASSDGFRSALQSVDAPSKAYLLRYRKSCISKISYFEDRS